MSEHNNCRNCCEMPTVVEDGVNYSKEDGTPAYYIYRIQCMECETFTHWHRDEGAAWREWDDDNACE